MFSAEQLAYSKTSAFTPIVTAYLNSDPLLRPFYAALPTPEGIRQSLSAKQQQPVDRRLLVDTLTSQYATVPVPAPVQQNIERLLAPTTFTICTAHQPNLFTGPLYFVYKILHAIRLADSLTRQLAGYHFVPVYYMGSEDADFAELNHTYVDGKRIEWKKEQRGAVGRMTVDKTLLQLITELEGQLGVEPFGAEVVSMLRMAYTQGKTIQQATFELLTQLYGAYGLIVLIPDHPALKRTVHQVFLDDLFLHTPATIVQETSARIKPHFDVQAHPRDVNLFYLNGDVRERIVREEEGFSVVNTILRFTAEEIKQELVDHPERFSPNVILRGLYQETILPNVAFVGGGGELAYWLQLKDLFDHYGVVYPALVLRNSFLIVEQKWKKKADSLRFTLPDFFRTENELMNEVVNRYATYPVTLNGKLEEAETLFSEIGQRATEIDPTLRQHVAAIRARSIKVLRELEKKMLRAAKRRYSDQDRQIRLVRAALFPNNGLQERKENFSLFYARWGKAFIDSLYQHSLSLEQHFTILTEDSEP